MTKAKSKVRVSGEGGFPSNKDEETVALDLSTKQRVELLGQLSEQASRAYGASDTRALARIAAKYRALGCNALAAGIERGELPA